MATTVSKAPGPARAGRGGPARFEPTEPRTTLWPVNSGSASTNGEVGAALEDRGWRFYGIALRDQPARRARLERQAGELGVDLHLHLAERPSGADGFVSSAMRGCFESHLACLRQAREDDAEVAAFLEDDVVVGKAFSRYMPGIEAWLRDRPWSLLYVGYLEDQSPTWFEPVELVGPGVAEGSGWHTQGTHFYVVHRRAIDALIANFEERQVPGGHKIAPDGVLSEFHRDEDIRPLFCVPNLAYQAPGESSTSPRFSLKNKLLGIPVAAKAIGVVKAAQRDRRGKSSPAEWVEDWNRRAAEVGGPKVF